MSDTATHEVLLANRAFYAAIQDGNLAAMDTLWATGRAVSCTHPDRPAIFGRDQVMESWRQILDTPLPPQILEVAPCAVVTGGTAMVLCREIVGGVELMASNAFVREGGRWRMINHQVAEVPEDAEDDPLEGLDIDLDLDVDADPDADGDPD